MSQIVWPRSARALDTFDGACCFKFTVLRLGLGEPERSTIAVGFSRSATPSTHPSQISYGVMIRGNEFCVIENGVQVELWAELPGDANTFRIYKHYGQIKYTVSTSPESRYTSGSWQQDTAPRWDGDDNDEYATEYRNEYEEFFRGAYTKGEEFRTTKTPPYNFNFVDALFSKWDDDIYGDTAYGEIYGAVKLPIYWAVAYFAPFGARMPLLRTRISDTAFGNLIYAKLPILNSLSSDLLDNHIRAALPFVTTKINGENVFDVRANSIYAKLPLLIASSNTINTKANRLPLLKTKIVGVNTVKAALPMLNSRLGDLLNLAYATLPALKSSSIGEIVEAPTARGQVVIPMGFVIQFNGSTGDAPTGGADTPPMETRALVCFADGDISVFSAMEMATAEMTGYLGGEVGIIRYAELKTVSMVGVLGGSIDAEAVSTLQAVPMFMLLGGSIGGEASSPQDVVQWAGVGEFDAANEVFCASIEDGGVGGTTRYRAYAFNSFATIDGKHYGANAGGLFLLDGNADGAEKINSEFGFGQLDFGKPNMKNISYCYIGARAGAMRLGIDSLVDGKPTRGNYASRAHGGSIREVRFDLGRGLRSTYVIPTFYNNNGEDFEVDNIRFLLAESTRRI